MKKTLLLVAVVLAIASRGFAQDTITGTVSRIAAPYFEQNVCDSRFAIVSEDETYYVMVDNYWPNPYLEDLVIHYDTIPVGDTVSVVGNIVEMEDANGEAFLTIDISKNLDSNYQQILGFFYYNEVFYPGPNPISAACFVKYTGLDLYHIVINGELQTGIPFIFNGRTLIEDKRYLFIGNSDVWTDYNGNTFNVFELVDALPYDVGDLTIEGILTMENDLCLSSPRDEKQYLSLFDGDEHHYLTNKRQLKTDYINDAVFMEGDSVVVGGFELIRYNLFGAPFNTMEIVKLQSTEECILMGGAGTAGMPYINIGPPVPGVFLAFYSGGTCFYIITPNGEFSDDDFFIVGNDTILVTPQQMKASCAPSVFINNYLTPNYSVNIHQVEFEEYEETLQCTLAIEENPFYWGSTLVVITSDNVTNFLKPYLYTNTPPNHITIGDKTVYVGDSFTATGMVSFWYHNNEIIENVIDITEISNVTGLADEALADISIYHTTAKGFIQIVSKQPMKTISICDYTGHILLIKYFDSKQATIDLKDFNGLAIFQVDFENGQTVSRKVVL